jgi:hypothetical protein
VASRRKGLEASEAQELKSLREENSKLKRVVADFTPDKVAKGLLKKLVTPAARRTAVSYTTEQHQISERRAC